MLRSRISRRVLAYHHLALTEQLKRKLSGVSPDERLIGIVDTAMSPFETIKALEQDLPLATGINTETNIDNATVSKDVRFAFIEEHLRYTTFELIKNSVLSALSRGRSAERVNVTIADNPRAICVRVSDACEFDRLTASPDADNWQPEVLHLIRSLTTTMTWCRTRHRQSAPPSCISRIRGICLNYQSCGMPAV